VTLRAEASWARTSLPRDDVEATALHRNGRGTRSHGGAVPSRSRGSIRRRSPPHTLRGWSPATHFQSSRVAAPFLAQPRCVPPARPLAQSPVAVSLRLARPASCASSVVFTTDEHQAAQPATHFERLACLFPWILRTLTIGRHWDLFCRIALLCFRHR